MPLKPELLAGLLHKAVDEPIGIEVKTNNAKRLQIELDEFKRSQSDWAELMCCLTTYPDTLFIIHKSVELDP